MTDSTGTAEVFEIARVFRRTFGAIGRNAALFLGLAVILAGIPQLISAFYRANAGSIDKDGAPAVAAAGVGGLLALLGSTVLQVSVTRATVSDLVGETPAFVACLRNGIALLLPMIGLAIATAVGIGLASLALVVPGIILYVAWSVAVPAYVQERLGVFGSMSRSRALTRGARWKIFAVLLVWWILSTVLEMPAGALTAATNGPSTIAVLIEAAGNTLTTMVLATIQAAIYVELRDVKEGVSPKDLESIFA